MATWARVARHGPVPPLLLPPLAPAASSPPRLACRHPRDQVDLVRKRSGQSRRKAWSVPVLKTGCVEPGECKFRTTANEEALVGTTSRSSVTLPQWRESFLRGDSPTRAADGDRPSVPNGHRRRRLQPACVPERPIRPTTRGTPHQRWAACRLREAARLRPSGPGRALRGRIAATCEPVEHESGPGRRCSVVAAQRLQKDPALACTMLSVPPLGDSVERSTGPGFRLIRF
ncbi:hypothetical protein IscW_ISCW023386 [Ixodes scapularis]|uniref:Uncharacterized protein n=1 Tax=Ixodes scapularis TaxID=6945 RepID=B7QK36_IXOSC|nr:hypothetical protein IscW_ISCW023386 [Ixodes scapularis]|eukprot:XP_002415543.1 hypothetical protein IscW_ISCW023386 [Ixodes scapularis]